MHDLDRDPPADWRHLRPLMDDAWQDLREPDRLAILLRYFEGRDLRTVGSALGVTEDAARMRVDRALTRLGESLRKRGITTTAAALGLALGAHGTEVVPVHLAAKITTAAIGQAFAAGVGVGAGATGAGTPAVLGRAPLAPRRHPRFSS